MEYLKIEPRRADKARKALLRLGAFDKSRATKHSRSYVLFPLSNIGRAKIKKLIGEVGGALVDVRERSAIRKEDYKKTLEGMLEGVAEEKRPVKGYDLLGSTALVEVPKGLSKNGKDIASALMRSNKQVHTVLAKVGAVKGIYRIRKVRYLAGKRTYNVEYKENGCTFRFDIRKTFFSNRLSFERSRLLKLVKRKEHVMVMFAGVGPFAIEIAKAVPSASVVAIELNEDSYKYMLDNIEGNKTKNVEAVLGDVHKVSKKYGGFADRIIMPLPMSSLEFLDDVYTVAKDRCKVHLYVIGKEDSIFTDAKKTILKHAQKRHYSVRFTAKRIARPYSAKDAEAVLDFIIQKVD